MRNNQKMGLSDRLGGGGHRLSNNKIKYTFSLAITIIGLLSLFVGTSYAILKGTSTSDNDQIIKTGSVKLKLTEKFENIDKKITVMSDVDGLVQETTYDFNLKNIGSEPAKFDIKLVNEVPSDYAGEVLLLDYFKIGLEINGEEHGPMSLEDAKGIIDSDIIYKNELINYKLRIWLDEEKSEELKTKEDYKAFLKLEVEAKQRVEEMDTLDTTTTFSYTGDVQEYRVPRDGYYKIEAWGAEGGSSAAVSGKGGYTSGEIYLEAGEKLYFYVGGKGSTASANTTYISGGYNGGGQANASAGTGGGATDVRLEKGVWNDTSSLASRIMVAGAGGGAGIFNNLETGGSGGGIIGTDGGDLSSEFLGAGHGGTQISGGSLGSATGVDGSASIVGTIGSFGTGGKAGYHISYTHGAGAGGAGYYGGAGGNGRNGGGAGGSSYISGHTGCVAVTSQDDTTPKNGCTTGTTDNSCSIHYSNKKFINTVMIDGSGYAWNNDKTVQVNMPNPTQVNTDYEKGIGNTGNGYAKITLLEENLEKEFNYTGDVQEYKVSKRGYYYIEMAGAGEINKNGYSKGAKTSGYIYLEAGEELYFYVGARGNTFNGGGYSPVEGYLASNCDMTGNGATDVRLVKGNWNNISSLISRIMVAGAAGRGNSASIGDPDGVAIVYGNTGSGGSLFGLSGCYSYNSSYGTVREGNPGTQISGGSGGVSDYSAGSTGGAGGFGYGGSGGSYLISGSYAVCNGYGGGGGYYGAGGSAGARAGYWGPEGSSGGSSYISGYAGVNSVKESTTITHTNQTIHYSGKYFVNSKMIEGANSGNGYAKIKYVGNKPKKINKLFDNVRYIKNCNNYNSVNNDSHWIELQAIKDGINIAKGKTVTGIANAASTHPYSRITDGDITYSNYSMSSSTGNQCVTVDLEKAYDLDEIAVWNYFGDARRYNDNYTYVSSDNSNWKMVIDEQLSETSNGHRANAYEIGTAYQYTGNYMTYNVSKTGTYKIDLWGAQGGSYSTSYIGGYGAYTSGEIYLQSGDELYIYVGGQGANTSSGTGGYNGGGNGVAEGSYKGYPGGGATDIRLVKGTWNDQKSLASRIMVAGAGGGTGYHTTPYYSPGGHAGGLTGYAGTSTHSVSSNLANAGGTQTKAGYNNYSSLGVETVTSGGFGYGGSGTRGSTYGKSGGGSGYYGGSGGPEGLQPGGGGSSYISGHTGCVAVTSQDDTTPKSGCTTGTTDNSCSVHYSNKKFTNTVMIDGNGYSWSNVKGEQVKIPNPEGGYYALTFGHDGNGFARITYIG